MVRATPCPGLRRYEPTGDYRSLKRYCLAMNGIDVSDDGLVLSPYLHDSVLVEARLCPEVELAFRRESACFKVTALEDSLLWCSGLSLGGIVSQTFAFKSHAELERVVSQAHSDLSVDSLMRGIEVMQLKPCGLFFLMNYLDDVVLFVKDLSKVRWSEVPASGSE